MSLRDAVRQRLMTTPGVGPIVAFTHRGETSDRLAKLGAAGGFEQEAFELGFNHTLQRSNRSGHRRCEIEAETQQFLV